MIITYDDVWSTFLDNYKVNTVDIPTDEFIIYNDIRNAVMMVNNKLRTKFKADDTSELIIGAETEDDRLIIAHYIKLAYLINEKVVYESLYQPISPDVGVRNYNSQLNSLDKSIARQESYIEYFILNTREDFL
jgi:predicted DNA-binding helix-hairpin-helix protein